MTITGQDYEDLTHGQGESCVVVEPVYVQNRVSVNEISSLKEEKLEWRKMVKCQLLARLASMSGPAVQQLEVVYLWEDTDGEFVSVFCFYPIRSNDLIKKVTEKYNKGSAAAQHAISSAKTVSGDHAWQQSEILVIFRSTNFVGSDLLCYGSGSAIAACIEFNRGKYSNSLEMYKRVPQVYPRCPARMFTPTGPTGQTHWGDLMANNPMPAHSADALLKALVKSIADPYQSQLNRVVVKEDYEDAARIKVAIAAVATNDTVGRVMAQLNLASLSDDKVPRSVCVASDHIAPLELQHYLQPVRFVIPIPDAFKEESFQAYTQWIRLSSSGTTTHEGGSVCFYICPVFTKSDKQSDYELFGRYVAEGSLSSCMGTSGELGSGWR
ncbi:hypothetical protein Tco_0977326 [Tanacetum coccineum]|uniref:Uncharacterized protein n=1 Tax=Tanacetum coccineum TaxID=301880 RepID=A0ABQ5EJS1_9ASTR